MELELTKLRDSIDREQNPKNRQKLLRQLEKKQKEIDKRKKASTEQDDKAEKIQSKLSSLHLCPMGFRWFQVDGGWKCKGGSHFVTDQKLKESFSSWNFETTTINAFIRVLKKKTLYV